MDEKDSKKPLEGTSEDEIGSALDEAVIASTRAKSGEASPAAVEGAAPSTGEPSAPGPTPAPAEAAPPAAPEWFLGIDDNQEGPFSLEQIREMFASGKISRETLCWKAGLTDWLEIAHTAELAALAPAKGISLPPAPYMATAAPAPSLTSLVQGELDKLERPREQPAGEVLGDLPKGEEPSAPEPEESTYRPTEVSLQPRPLAPMPAPWTDTSSKKTTYLMVGAGAVIVVLLGLVAFLLLRPPAEVATGDESALDAGSALAQGPAPDAGAPAAVAALDAGAIAEADAGAEEPGLSEEELAALPESLTPQEIMKVVVADRDSLSECVDAQQEADPKLHGKLVMRWEIQVPSGKTANAMALTKQFEGSVMATCVAERIKTWEFPPHRKAGKPVDFPFKF